MLENKIKVILCSPRGFGGGIGMWTDHLLNYYDSQQNKSISLSWIETKGKGKEVTAGTPLYIRVFRGLYNYIPFLQQLNYQLKSEHYDVVHISSSAGLSLLKDYLSIVIAHKYNCGVVIHFHFGRIPVIFVKQGWEYRILSKVINKSDAVVVLDKKSYETILQQGCSHVYKTPNPLAVQVLDRISKKNILRKKRTILFVGHLDSGKGIFELVDACKKISNVQLTMIGKGTFETIAELKNNAGNNCEGWLRILGTQPHDLVIDKMLETAVFVLPSYSEGFPNVIIESMACGCSIVATNVGAIPEMLNVDGADVCGLCVKPKDDVTLKTAIERMLDDLSFAEMCGKNAQIRVKNMYSMPIVWGELTKLWKEVATKEI